jgi:hypothetical protein
MSINSPAFAQRQVAQALMNGMPVLRQGGADGNVRASGMDLWASEASQKEMSVKQGDDATEITTPGGYRITGFGQSEKDGGKLEIVGPDGKKTTVWGDPHVDQADADGKSHRAFDVKARTTFTLPDNTVVTMNMKPSTNGTDTTMLSDVMVTNGAKGVLMSNMMCGKGKMTTEEGYGPLMDDMVDDGNVLDLGRDGQFYETNRFGGRSKVTQASIDRTESLMNPGSGSLAQPSDDELAKQFMSRIFQMLSGFDSDFLRTVQSGISHSYSSRYPNLGMQSLTLDPVSTSWF